MHILSGAMCGQVKSSRDVLMSEFRKIEPGFFCPVTRQK